MKITPQRWGRAWAMSSRYVYLLAPVFPGVSLFYWLRNPYPLYHFEEWAWLALVPACLLQFLRPTVTGWTLVLLTYAWSVLLQIQAHVGAFQDMGSEDHSRWDGWSAELILFGFTTWFILVTTLVAICYPKKVDHAT